MGRWVEAGEGEGGGTSYWRVKGIVHHTRKAQENSSTPITVCFHHMRLTSKAFL